MHILFPALVAVAVLCSCGGKHYNGACTTDPSLICHSLKIQRHTGTELGDSDADSILNDSAGVAQENDGSGDTSCRVGFLRNGPVTTFSAGSGIINSSADFDAVIAEPGNAMIVNQINWCGVFKPNIIGCAPIGGDSLAVIRYSSRLEGIQWLHEFGHNKTRQHRDDARAVMYRSVGDTHRWLTSEECTDLKVPGAAPSGPGSALLPLSEGEGSGGAPSPPLAPIAEFVRRDYVHGIPIDEALRYDPSVVPKLLEMLSDNEERHYWPNVAVTLGLVGDASVGPRLIAFLEGGSGRLSSEEYAAKVSAVFALGYVANRTGSPVAIDYLRGGLNPTGWVDRAVPWRSPFDAQSASTAANLARVSVIALALSGREPAEAALRALRDSKPRDPTLEPLSDDLLDEALSAHQAVQDRGLAAYYERRTK